MKENIIAGSTVTVLYMYTDSVSVHVHVELHLSNQCASKESIRANHHPGARVSPKLISGISFGVQS